MDQVLEDSVCERAERDVLAEAAIKAASQLAEVIQSLERVKPTAVLQATETAQQPAAEQHKNTAHKPLAAANGSTLEAKARLIADVTKATNSASPPSISDGGDQAHRRADPTAEIDSRRTARSNLGRSDHRRRGDGGVARTPRGDR